VKAYWDSSALVQATVDPALRARLTTEKGFTRTHTLSESFSALTRNAQSRLDADHAVRVLEQLSMDLEFTDLTAAEVIAALKKAKRKGVRGGHVHDLIHAAAADKCGAQELLTIDINDFSGLPDKAAVVGV
jgi:predicted nucleic acid-binding protein